MSNKRKSKWHECNVAHADGDRIRLWHHTVSGRKCSLRSRKSAAPEGRLPVKLVGKSWQHLLRGRLNLALLPEDAIYLRVLQLPECDSDEIRSMLEFQLEKISPVPVQQICWGFEILPSGKEGEVTVLVLMAESSRVESCLEELESIGYSSDRLESSACHELLSLDREADRIRIRISSRGEQMTVIAAWFLGGTLHQAMTLRLPDSVDGCRALVAQLDRMHLAGELEGWLKGEPDTIHLLSPPDLAGPWQATLGDWSPLPLESSPLSSHEEQAAISAGRAARQESQADLLPEAHRIRYRQQFVDGIWMKGVGAMVLCYILGVLVYFVMVEWAGREQRDLRVLHRRTAIEFTNVVRLENRIRILEEQKILRSMPLDCLLAISSRLPEKMELGQFEFRPESVVIKGTVEEASDEIPWEFHDALHEIEAENGRKLFSDIAFSGVTPAPGNPEIRHWEMTCTLDQG